MPNLTETINKLVKFSELEEGWRFGEGGAPEPRLIQLADKFIRYGSSLGIERFNVFTGSDKEVLVSFYVDEQALEFVFYPDGAITMAEDKNGVQVDFQEEITEREIYTHIWQLRFTTQTLFAPSIRETSIPRQERLTVQLSGLRAMAAASQSSSQNVQSPLLEVSANTSDDSTLVLPKSLVFTGSSDEGLCPTPA